MTYESVEFSIMDNPIYKKIFMTIYGNEYKSQKSSLSYFCKNEKELLEKTNEEIIIRFIRDVCLGSFFKKYGDYRLPLNRREVQLPFKLVNESLYIHNSLLLLIEGSKENVVEYPCSRWFLVGADVSDEPNVVVDVRLF